MIAKLIAGALRSKVRRDLSGKVKPGSLREKALIDFFGLQERPGITDQDLMNMDSMMQKWLLHNDWQERRRAYEEFTNEKWRW